MELQNRTIEQRVFNQDVATYLNHRGIPCKDGDRINCPYRSTADGQSFSLRGPFYTDFSHNDSGNVFELAVKLNGGDKQAAAKDLCASAGIDYGTGPFADQQTTRQDTLAALKIIRDAFPINDTTPQVVHDYLSSRQTSAEIASKYLSYIPSAEQLKVHLTPQQIERTGLANYCGKLILWYLKSDEPCYYLTRDITEKSYRKAPAVNLRNCLWNAEALYTDKDVVLGEGMFDCLSLMQLGYNVCSSMTCWLSDAEKIELVKALRWRGKHQPGRSFTICFDNDKAGIDAGRELAEYLFKEGVDCNLVVHRASASKEDINDLHVQGMQAEIQDLIRGARMVSEIFDPLVRDGQNLVYKALNNGNSQFAKRMLDGMAKKQKMTVKELIDSFFSSRQHYSEFYDDTDIFLNGGKCHVYNPAWGNGLREFSKRDLVDNLIQYQKNRHLSIDWNMLEVPHAKSIWKVSKAPRYDSQRATFNMFTPTDLMMLEKTDEPVQMPDQFQIVFDNIASPEEQDYLLNWMACYCQRLEKMQTVVVLWTKQGTGKDTMIELFGRIFGSYEVLARSNLVSDFNDYLRNAVIHFAELNTTNADVKDVQNRLKLLINEKVWVNEKYVQQESQELNNCVFISGNPDRANKVPVLINDDDRRFSIIGSGHNRNLAKVADEWGWSRKKMFDQLPQFAQYLANYDVDVERTRIPLENELRKDIIDKSRDPEEAAVSEWLDTHRSGKSDSARVQQICDAINAKDELQFDLKSKRVIQILKKLGYTVKQGNRAIIFGFSG